MSQQVMDDWTVKSDCQTKHEVASWRGKGAALELQKQVVANIR